HALVARRNGVKVAGITLWLCGGVSRLEGDPKSAGSEALIAGVGPLTSFVLALVGFGASYAISALPLAADLLMWLAAVNLALGLFNLVPAFPLDGGRLLSSFFWWRSGSRQRGVHSAVRIGRFFSFLMIAAGAFELFTGSVMNGIWIAFIGWFLLSAGSSEEAGTTIKALLQTVPVSTAMSAPVVTIPDWITVQQLLESVAPQHSFTTYPVHDQSGKLSGVVRLSELVRVPVAERGTKRLSECARAMSDVPTTQPTEDLSALIERLGSALERRVLVFDKGELVGILAPVDVARVLAVRQTMGGAGAR
ncbi:MAG TPA: site-2 protease family protein, partial [Patescibacteria group bacterium]|nr:site-2 protease family protein [Patescibacteria group bacterium]